MDSSDIIDLLTIVAVADKRTIGEADVVLWRQTLGYLNKDDCVDAIMAHRREQPGVWLEPGHVLQRVRAAIRDRYERADPDERELSVGPNVKRDRYGYVDKSAPDEEEYPAEWTTEQRMKATWESIERYRDGLSVSGERDEKSTPGRKASSSVRQQAMADIRRILNKTPIGATPDGETFDINPNTVRCPFCGSGVNEVCTIAGMPGRPREPMRRSRAHPSRIEAAAKAAGMTVQAAQVLARKDQMAAVRKFREENPAAQWAASERVSNASAALGPSTDTGSGG